MVAGGQQRLLRVGLCSCLAHNLIGLAVCNFSFVGNCVHSCWLYLAIIHGKDLSGAQG